MTEPTLATLFDKLMPLLIARRIPLHPNAVCEHGTECTVCPKDQPDPAFAPLLAVVREECNPDSFEHQAGLCECVVGDKDIKGDGYISRAAFWEQADKGALEGAYIKAIPHGDYGELADRIESLLDSSGDTRIPATQAVLERMEAMA